MLEDLVIKKEVLQALLLEMEKQNFTSTTLHEIRAFTIAQRRTKLALDAAPLFPEAADSEIQILSVTPVYSRRRK